MTPLLYTHAIGFAVRRVKGPANPVRASQHAYFTSLLLFNHSFLSNSFHMFNSLRIHVYIDPVVNGQSLSAELGCDVPYYRTPYNAASPSSSAGKSLPLLFASVLLSALYLLNL